MPESRIKRKRLVLSCFECKRRKLKCGREMPVCSRCVSVGHPEFCKYDPRFSIDMNKDESDLACPAQAWSPSDLAGQLSTPSLDNFDASFVLDDCQPSSWLSFQLHSSLEGSSSEGLSHESPIQLVESQVLQLQQLPPATDQRKSLSSPFRGPSHSTSIVASFQDLCKFMKQIVADHHILSAPQWASYVPDAEQPLPTYSKDEVDQAIQQLLPEQERCRRLATSYFDHFTGIYALFHVPSFWHEYEIYWSGIHENPIQFSVVLLAVVSCARCLFVDDPLSFNGDSSSARNEASRWLHAVEAWQTHRRAENTMIEGFQINCLILLSKILNDIDRENHFTASHALLADAISKGLHRDWKPIGLAESIYDRELRRKLWFAITEMNIEVCMEQGVPSMVSSLFADIGPSKGYDDIDYDSKSIHEPLNRPVDQLTDDSFARIAHVIRPLRYSVNNFVNEPRRNGPLDQAQLAALRAQIFDALNDLPSWSDSSVDSAGRNRGPIYRAVLELYLHELLLLLHLPSALEKNSSTPSAVDKVFQQFICARSACTIIKIKELLTSQGYSLIALGKANLLRASLCLCLLEGSALNNGITSLPIWETTQIKLVQSALSMVEQRVLSLGTDLQSLWVCAAASCYAESRRDPNTSSAAKNRTLDNIIALLSKMCLAQEQKTSGLGLSDAHFARCIMQIHQVCDIQYWLSCPL